MLSSDRSFNPRSSSHDELNDELWSKSTQKPLVLIFSKTEKVPIYGTFPSGSGDVTRTHDTPGMKACVDEVQKMSEPKTIETSGIPVHRLCVSCVHGGEVHHS